VREILSARRCPVCGSSEAQPLFRQTFATLSSGALLEGYDVVCCESCGFGFADGLPDPEEFDRYYAAMSKYERAAAGGRPSAWNQKRLRRIAETIARNAGRTDSALLDIGCATGALLAELRDVGYSDIHGLDPSPLCARLAREVYGLAVDTGVAADLALRPPEYGVIVLSAVLEHLCDPTSVLHDTRDALVEDGAVFVEVPDVTGFAECACAPFQQFSTEHINFFSSQSLENLLAAAGFEAITVERHSYEWSSSTREPVLLAVFRKSAATRPPVQDNTTRRSLFEYIAVCECIDHRIRQRLRELAETGRPVLVWGTGAHTLRLLQTGGLDGIDIAGFIDSDVNYQGKLLRGAPVLSPSSVAGRGEPILISSGTVHHEIAQQIREELGAATETIMLYE